MVFGLQITVSAPVVYLTGLVMSHLVDNPFQLAPNALGIVFRSLYDGGASLRPALPYKTSTHEAVQTAV